VFTRMGGNLGDPGSVAWMFDRAGVILVDRQAAPDEDRLLEAVLEAGAEDLVLQGDQWQVTADPAAFKDVLEALDKAGVPVASAEVTMLPQSTISLDGDQARKVLALIEALDDLDDVQAVFSNFDIPEEILAEAG
jgi:transcriptional/translational regulatory protein YebC/TACO1